LHDFRLILFFLNFLEMLVLDLFLRQSICEKGIKLRSLTGFSSSLAKSLIELFEVVAFGNVVHLVVTTCAESHEGAVSCFKLRQLFVCR
jgi:hypothetical protein